MSVGQARRCCLLLYAQLLQGLLRTSLADLGHRMASSGRCCRASCSTGLGTGTALFPRPFGLPGCDTTAATCAEKQGRRVFWGTCSCVQRKENLLVRVCHFSPQSWRWVTVRLPAALAARWQRPACGIHSGSDRHSIVQQNLQYYVTHLWRAHEDHSLLACTVFSRRCRCCCCCWPGCGGVPEPPGRS